MRTIIIRLENEAAWREALRRAGHDAGKLSRGVSRPGHYFSDEWTSEGSMGRLEVSCSGTQAHRAWVEYNKEGAR